MPVQNVLASVFKTGLGPGLDLIQGPCPTPMDAEMSVSARAEGLATPLSLGQGVTSSAALTGADGL